MEGISPPELTAPPQPQTSSAQYLFTPLIISMACMFTTFSAILTYHFLVVNYCVNRHRHRQAMADLLARGSTATASNHDSPIGVEEKVLQRIPILSYPINPKLDFRSHQKECVVCLGEMEEGAAVRLLPNCRHVFHVSCIDRWFLAHSSCPVCRSPVVPPPDDPSPSSTGPAGHGGSQLRRLSSAGTGLLRHAVSMVFPMEVEKLPRGGRLRRSLSMDQSDVVINIISAASDIGSSSSTTNYVVASASSSALESGSSRCRDASSSSSKLMKIRSFTQIRIHDVEGPTLSVV